MSAPQAGDRVAVAYTARVLSVRAGDTLRVAIEGLGSGWHCESGVPVEFCTTIPDPPKVGDRVDSAEQLDALPPYSVIVADGPGGMAAQKIGDWQPTDGGAPYSSTAIVTYWSARIVHIPEETP